MFKDIKPKPGGNISQDLVIIRISVKCESVEKNINIYIILYIVPDKGMEILL
jgi:hypothetical protein